MGDFLDDMGRHDEERMAATEHNFSVRALKAIAVYYKIALPRLDADEGLGWFHTNCPTFPVHIEARNIKVNLERLFVAMTREPVWVELMELVTDSHKDNVGIIVNAVGAGLYIAHTAWGLEHVAGYTRLMRQAKTREKGVVFEPLLAFLESVKRTGWTP